MSKLRTLQRTLALGGVTLALAASGALGTAHAAGADIDTSSATAGSTEGGNVSIQALPNCIDVIVNGRTARVYNWCSTTKYVKVIWAFASDSACTGLRPDHVLTSERSFPARFDGVQICA